MPTDSGQLADAVLFVGPRSLYDMSVVRGVASSGLVVAASPICLPRTDTAPWSLVVLGLPVIDPEWIAIPSTHGAWVPRPPEWWAVREPMGSPVTTGDVVMAPSNLPAIGDLLGGFRVSVFIDARGIERSVLVGLMALKARRVSLSGIRLRVSAETLRRSAVINRALSSSDPEANLAVALGIPCAVETEVALWGSDPVVVCEI